MTYVSCGSTADVAPGTMSGVEVEGKKILLANVDGTFYAIQRKCPHMGFDLAKGTLAGATITCRMHKATLRPEDGRGARKGQAAVFEDAAEAGDDVSGEGRGRSG